MDALLAQASHQFTTFAIRSGISIAGGYAIKQVSTYISKQPQDARKPELELLSKRLDQKIKIVTPAIDLIEIIAARGNTTLNSTVQLTVSLRNDINDFGQRMSDTMTSLSKGTGGKEQTKAIIEDMKALLSRIEDAVPLISLALTTSGANLSASLPDTVSPSRLLQASSYLQQGDAQFNQTQQETQIGPSFSLKLYTIFEGHSRRDPKLSDITWQETYAKAIFEVVRMPMTADGAHSLGKPLEHPLEYLYHFRVTENLDDGRYHEELESGTYKRDAQGFIRGASRDIPVHSIARLFFSASGRLLNIEDARTPVLVLKINHALPGPSALVRAIFSNQYGNDGADPAEETSLEIQSGLIEDDLEWIALEMWMNDDKQEEDSDSDDDASEHTEPEADKDSANTEQMDELAMQLQILNVSAKTQHVSPVSGQERAGVATLSLLEYMLRLAALQTSEQTSLLSVSDERISLFLRDDARRSGSTRRKTSDRQVADPRTRSDRHDTPASAASYDEYIPGTQRRPRYRATSESGGGGRTESPVPRHVAAATAVAGRVQTPGIPARSRLAPDTADTEETDDEAIRRRIVPKALWADGVDKETAEASVQLEETSPLARLAEGVAKPKKQRVRWPRVAALKASPPSEMDNPFK